MIYLPKKAFHFTVAILLSFGLAIFGCDKEEDEEEEEKTTTTTSPSSSTTSDTSSTTTTTSDSFGSDNIPQVATAMAAGIPASFKTGGNVTSLHLLAIGDPLGSDTVSPPPSAGNVLWLVWNMDYNSYCNDAKLTSGECFRVHPSTSTTDWTYYYKPAPLIDATICRTEDGVDSQTIGNSMVSKACQFEYNLMEMGAEIDECYESAGEEVDFTEYIPWAADWGIPTTIKFQGLVTSEEGGSFWYGINRDVTGADGQYMVSLSDYGDGEMQVVYLDRANNRFFHFIIGSQGTGTREGFMAYMGELPDANGETTGSFEAMQLLAYTSGSMAGEQFLIRLKSNGSYVWIQNWSTLPGETGFDASAPDFSNDDECLKLETNLPSSKYVDKADCLTSFSKATEALMNADTNFTLKFSGDNIKKTNWWGKYAELYDPATNPLTSTTTTSCLPASSQ